MDDKNTLRKQAKEIRQNLNIKQISAKIVSNIRKLKEYKEAKKVMIFYPLENEINLLELMSDNKEFYLPRMAFENLECCPYAEDEILNVANFGVKEPISSAVDKNLMDIIFVPALCVDKNCMRIGYGKGYYDRFLTNYNGLTIIPIPEELIFSEIYSNTFDIACNKVITQKRDFCAL